MVKIKRAFTITELELLSGGLISLDELKELDEFEIKDNRNILDEINITLTVRYLPEKYQRIINSLINGYKIRETKHREKVSQRTIIDALKELKKRLNG